VVDLGLHDSDAARRQCLGLLLIQLISCSHIEGAGDDRDMLNGGVRVGRNLRV
jgi:hypothetical protein